eukprot:g1493.t1
MSDGDLLDLMEGFRAQDEARWKAGQASGGIYHGQEDHLAVLNKAYSLFAVSNPLHTDIWPSVVKFEAEIVSMAAGLLGGGDPNVCGSLTSGGTESIICAAKTHRQWAERTKGITAPEIIVGTTKHAAIEKACDLLRIKMVELPVDPDTFAVDPEAVRTALTPNTIMIYGSAPSYPQGIIDPIEALSALAVEAGVGLHVDCCLGGFFLPFARQLRSNVPAFDFALPGVTSMSCDTHKYGYAHKGTSVVLYRDAGLREHQFFAYPDWTGGKYITPTLAGSRPGALSAACWASMVRLGHRGFLEITEQILRATEAVAAAARAIPGIVVLGEPVAMVLAIASRDFNIFSLQKLMHARGFGWSSCQNPACLHMCFTLLHAGAQTDAMIAVLRECAAELMAKAQAGERDETTAGIYGVTDDSGAVGGGAAGKTKGKKKDVAASLRRYQGKVLDMPKIKAGKSAVAPAAAAAALAPAAGGVAAAVAATGDVSSKSRL